MSVGVSAHETTSVHFLSLLSKSTVYNGYIHWLSEFYVFQQDSAPAHRARKTADLLTMETPDCILPMLWPPNSPICPDLNPVNYRLQSVVSNAGESLQKVDQ